MGTPEFAKEALEKLAFQHDVVCVYTQAPKPKGRGYKITPSPVHEYALSRGIEVRIPKTLRNQDEQDYFKNLNLDVAVVAAYGLLLPKPILEAPKWGCLNIHGSLLPRWRGASPIQQAVLHGDLETGITIMKMDVGMDTGPILLKSSIPIESWMTSGDVFERLAPLGSNLMLQALNDIENLKEEVQNEAFATHAPKILKTDAILDWNLPAVVLERMVKAFLPWPGAYFEYEGEQFKVLEAKVVDFWENDLTIKTKEKFLSIVKIQRAGHKVMNVDEFLRGFSFKKKLGL